MIDKLKTGEDTEEDKPKEVRLPQDFIDGRGKKDKGEDC